MRPGTAPQSVTAPNCSAVIGARECTRPGRWDNATGVRSRNELHVLLGRDRHAFAAPHPDQIGFEFGEGGKNIEEQLAHRIAGSWICRSDG